MIVMPSSSSASLPSIVTLGMASVASGRRSLRRVLQLKGATSDRHVLEELGSELGDERLRRHGGGIGQNADRVAHHVVRDVQEQLQVLRASRAFLEVPTHFVKPPRALTARRALPAGLVVIGPPDTVEGTHYARRVVE